MVTPRFFATCVTFFARFSLDKAVKLSAILRFLDAAISSVSPMLSGSFSVSLSVLDEG